DRGHRDRDFAAYVSAKQHADCTKDSGTQIHISLFAVFEKGAQSNWWEQYKQGRPLGGVLVHVQQMNHGRDEDDSTADSQQANKATRAKTDNQYDDRHVCKRSAFY